MTTPERIYMQFGTSAPDDTHPAYFNTWSEKRVTADDVEYVRADLPTPEVERLQAENAALREEIDGDWRKAGGEIVDAIQKNPDIAPDVVDMLRYAFIKDSKAKFCAHCGMMFGDASNDIIAKHMQTCQSNPVVIENAALRAELAKREQPTDGTR